MTLTLFFPGFIWSRRFFILLRALIQLVKNHDTNNYEGHFNYMEREIAYQRDRKRAFPIIHSSFTGSMIPIPG